MNQAVGRQCVKGIHAARPQEGHPNDGHDDTPLNTVMDNGKNPSKNGGTERTPLQNRVCETASEHLVQDIKRWDPLFLQNTDIDRSIPKIDPEPPMQQGGSGTDSQRYAQKGLSSQRSVSRLDPVLIKGRVLHAFSAIHEITVNAVQSAILAWITAG